MAFGESLDEMLSKLGKRVEILIASKSHNEARISQLTSA